MALIPVYMPKFGMTMTAGLIVDWHHTVGDEILKGDLLLTVETEKVNTEINAPASGTLVEVRFQADEEVPVGEVIAYIEETV